MQRLFKKKLINDIWICSSKEINTDWSIYIQRITEFYKLHLRFFPNTICLKYRSINYIRSYFTDTFVSFENSQTDARFLGGSLRQKRRTLFRFRIFLSRNCMPRVILRSNQYEALSLGRSYETRSRSTLARSPRWSRARDPALEHIIDIRKRRSVRTRCEEEEKEGEKWKKNVDPVRRWCRVQIPWRTMRRQRCPISVPC